jgi:hypothetical protein
MKVYLKGESGINVSSLSLVLYSIDEEQREEREEVRSRG